MTQLITLLQDALGAAYRVDRELGGANSRRFGRTICGFTMASALFLAPAPTRAQERIDLAFHPTNARPEYLAGERPLVLVDRAHHNFHAGPEQFEQFARLLRDDGYRVRGLEERFSAKTLAGADVLVMVNAVASREDSEWSLPTSPAFTADEVNAVRQWVERGGSLLLIADHMPFPGAMDRLARAFGIEFLNGFAIEWEDWDPLVFHRADASLPPHPVTDGRRRDERVEHAVTFVSGSAFRPLKSARCVSPMLVLGHGVVSYQPDRAWQFTDQTPRVPVDGWLQGATLEPGRGRVAVFGEAAMFAAQLAGAKGQPVGMNSPRASFNLQLLFNTLHWLSRAPGYGPAATRPCLAEELKHLGAVNVGVLSKSPLDAAHAVHSSLWRQVAAQDSRAGEPVCSRSEPSRHG